MYAHLLYNQASRAEICLNSALATIGLEIKIIGVLGKRTRFQEKFTPQLVVRVSFICFDVLNKFIKVELMFALNGFFQQNLLVRCLKKVSCSIDLLVVRFSVLRR